MEKIIMLAGAAVLVLIAVVLLITCSKTEEEEEAEEEEHICGGWTKVETELTEEELAIFSDAMKDADRQFVPKKIIGRQVVAGLNYKFLCEQGGREWVALIFHDLEGGNHLTSITEYKE